MSQADIQQRSIVARSKGRPHGPVTRLFSPGDIGEEIKPFVFLDHFDFRPTGSAMFPMHPHSGIATLTLLLSGKMRYEDTTGAQGELAAGSLEWLQAAGGVWHDASPIGTDRFHGYQLWLALPQAIENGPPQSQYLPPHDVAKVGPARVVLGRYDNAVSRFARRPEPACSTYNWQTGSAGSISHRSATRSRGYTPIAARCSPGATSCTRNWRSSPSPLSASTSLPMATPNSSWVRRSSTRTTW